MPSVQCPRCGLYNHESAQRCDCGYDFASGEVNTSYLYTERASSHPSRLKRSNIPRMVLLTLITGGLYYPSWFLLQRDGINSLNAKEKLRKWPFVVAIVLFAGSLALSTGAGEAEAGTADTVLFAELADICCGLLLWVQCFKVRRIFEAHLFLPGDHRTRVLSGVAVFFLQIFYLQYVINKRLAQVA